MSLREELRGVGFLTSSMPRVSSINGRYMAEMAKSLFSMLEEPCSPILNMSSDHLHTIMLLLPAESILSFSLTCKKMYSVATSNTLWECICRREWGTASVDAIKASPSSSCSNQLQSDLPWSVIYKQVMKIDSVSCFKLPRMESSSEIPSPRASHSLNFISEWLVLFGGGCSGGRHLDDTWVAQIGASYPKSKTVRWRKVEAGQPSGRFGHTCVAIGDRLILFAGMNDRGTRLNDTWLGRLRPDGATGVTLQWTQLTITSSLPPPRGAHAACCLDKGKMVVYGGIESDGNRLGDTWILEISEDMESASWREVISNPSPPPCSGHTLTRTETKIVLFGGRGSGYEVMNDVWVLQRGTLKWVRVEMGVPRGMPLPRAGHTATRVMGGRVLVYGGEDAERHRTNDFWLMDVSERGVTWRRLKGKGYRPLRRSFHKACSDRTGRYVFVFGGMVDGVVQPADTAGLMFDNDCFFLHVFSFK